jgi:endonuclease YncB( thermonuclease family)
VINAEDDKMKSLHLIGLIGCIIISIAASSPDEIYGRVTHVVDGDTFDLEIQDSDRLLDDVIRVRLADIDCPETRGPKASPEGKAAAEYARSWLLNQYVYLDLDDKTGRDPYDRWVAVVYIKIPNDELKNFNRMLVDSGHAKIDDYKNNEFDPSSWWG